MTPADFDSWWSEMEMDRAEASGTDRGDEIGRRMTWLEVARYVPLDACPQDTVKLRAEIERLRVDLDKLHEERAVERAAVERMLADQAAVVDPAKVERAKVVAWLFAQTEDSPDTTKWWRGAMEDAAEAIERGEHDK